MSLYETPTITSDRRRKLAEIDRLRTKLGDRIVPSERWVTAIRRQAKISAYASSTQIEGFVTPPERAAALLGDAPPADVNDHAFVAYARAMQHVGVVAAEPSIDWSRRLLLDLHFDLCAFQPDGRPGALRNGPVFVTGARGDIAFTGPPAEQLDALLDELVVELADESGHPLVRAAIAHLNLVSIHPFEDGNGRTSRVLQSLIIAASGESAPELGSIEGYLAEHTADYYAALESAQGGSFDPTRSAGAWLDFCLDAHQAQAKLRIELVDAAAARWQKLEELVASRGWPERIVIALEQGLVGGLTRSSYVRESGVAEPTASIDLRRLVDAGLMDSVGGGRSTRYVASASLRRLV